MATEITSCPIWGEGYKAEGYFDEATRTYHIENSPRAGGGYVIPQVELNASLPRLDESAKARLTTWLIDQYLQGNKQPAITEEVITYVKNKLALPVGDRADRLLQFIADQSKQVGDHVLIDRECYEVFAWSESTKWNEVHFCVNHLLEQGWLIQRYRMTKGPVVSVSVEGCSRISELSSSTELSQTFAITWSSDEYIRKQATRMEDALASDDFELAIGTAKELIETCCKTILEKRGASLNGNPEMSDLTKAVFKELKLTQDDVSPSLKGADSFRRIQSNLASLCNDIARLRNLYGTGHGKTADSPSLSKRHAKLIVSSAAALTVYLFETELEPTPILESASREPLGQWLVDNVPRDTDFEPPSRKDCGRPNAFLEEENR